MTTLCTPLIVLAISASAQVPSGGGQPVRAFAILNGYIVRG